MLAGLGLRWSAVLVSGWAFGSLAGLGGSDVWEAGWGARAVAIGATYACWYSSWLWAPLAESLWLAPLALWLTTAALAALAADPTVALSLGVVVLSCVTGESRYARWPRARLADEIRMAFTWAARWHLDARELALWAGALIVWTAARWRVLGAQAIPGAAAHTAVWLVEARLAWRQRQWPRGAALWTLSQFDAALIDAQRAAHGVASHAAFLWPPPVASRLVSLATVAGSEPVPESVRRAMRLGPQPARVRPGASASSAYAWRGCTRDSLPCPMLWTVNVVGLNTPPCCAATMAGLVAQVAAVLDAAALAHWLDGGTLLGAVRDGGLIPWEDDVDIGFVLPGAAIDESLGANAALCALLAAFEATGQLLVTLTAANNIHLFARAPRAWRAWSPETLRDEPHAAPRVDLVPYFATRARDGRSVLTRRGQKGRARSLAAAGIPVELILPPRAHWCVGLGQSVYVPAETRKVLRALYGRSYDEPVYSFLKLDTAVRVREAVDREWMPRAETAAGQASDMSSSTESCGWASDDTSDDTSADDE